MTTIWHNPRCSKSRQTLALLQDHGITPTVRLYLDDAPTVAEITQARDTLGCRVIDMMRTGEALFRELGLDTVVDDEILIAAMAAHPKLIERPLVFSGGRASFGRPPEQVLDIL